MIRDFSYTVTEVVLPAVDLQPHEVRSFDCRQSHRWRFLGFLCLDPAGLVHLARLRLLYRCAAELTLTLSPRAVAMYREAGVELQGEVMISSMYQGVFGHGVSHVVLINTE